MKICILTCHSFEAVWSGDLDQVKKLTLLPGNGASENPPLEIAIVNPHGLSTFSCAIYRGHLSVAKAILQIAQAQFDARQGQGKKKDTYVLRGDDTDSEGCDVSSQRDDVFDIHRHIRLQSGNDVFTIDNIALKGDLIGSKVSPLVCSITCCKLVEDK